MKKMVIVVTVPLVLDTWFKDQPKYLSKFYEVEIITAFSHRVKSISEHENVNIKIMDFTRKINFIKDMKVLAQLFLYFMVKRPDIVYTLTPKAGLLGMMASWMAFIPHRIHNVVGLPHLEAHGKRKTILELSEKLTYIFSTNLYCNSLNLKKDIENKMTKKPVKIIGHGSVNGVDTEYFKDMLSEDKKQDIRKSIEIEIDDFVITFVGRIVKDKGINELVNVFSALKLRHNNISLLLIGDYEDDLDPISSQTKKIINEDPKILQIDFQKDIRKYLAITNLFVLPSYREGLPNVLIEAGSYGIPLVATNINGCNEIITNGENGALVNKRDENSLFTAIEKFIVDKEYYNYIKKNIRESIYKRYDQKIFFEKLHEEFISIEERSK